jgi:hypothetical protein
MTGPGSDRDRGPRPTWNRIALWIVGAAVGAWLVISGLVGILTHR